MKQISKSDWRRKRKLVFGSVGIFFKSAVLNIQSTEIMYVGLLVEIVGKHNMESWPGVTLKGCLSYIVYEKQ